MLQANNTNLQHIDEDLFLFAMQCNRVLIVLQTNIVFHPCKINKAGVMRCIE